MCLYKVYLVGCIVCKLECEVIMYWKIGKSSFLVLTQKTRFEMTSGVQATPCLLNNCTIYR